MALQSCGDPGSGRQKIEELRHHEFHESIESPKKRGVDGTGGGGCARGWKDGGGFQGDDRQVIQKDSFDSSDSWCLDLG